MSKLSGSKEPSSEELLAKFEAEIAAKEKGLKASSSSPNEQFTLKATTRGT